MFYGRSCSSKASNLGNQDSHRDSGGLSPVQTDWWADIRSNSLLVHFLRQYAIKPKEPTQISVVLKSLCAYIEPCSCAQFANLHPGANLHPLMSRSYANKLCSYVLNDSNSVLSQCMCVGGRGGGGGGASSIFRRRSVLLKLSHYIHIKAKSEKHIHNMITIFYLYFIQ